MPPILYIMQPKVTDLPAGVPAGSLAWFVRFSSGHLAHATRYDPTYAYQKHQIGVTEVTMSYAEYQQYYKEAHWYEKVD